MVYRCATAFVCELAGNSSDQWTYDSISAWLQDPPRNNANPWGYQRHDSWPAIVYRTISDDIGELVQVEGSWEYHNLTEETGAIKTAGDPTGFKRSSSSSAVYYRGTDNRVYEIYKVISNDWAVREVS